MIRNRSIHNYQVDIMHTCSGTNVYKNIKAIYLLFPAKMLFQRRITEKKNKK